MATLRRSRAFRRRGAASARRWLQDLSRLPGALVLFEAPHRLRQTLEDVQTVLGDRTVVVAHELTKLHESWHRGLARELLADPLLPEKGEFTLVIGPVRVNCRCRHSLTARPCGTNLVD